MKLRALVGSGDRIGLFTLPFAIVGVILNVAYPSVFDVGGPPPVVGVVSAGLLVVGVAIWIWSVALIVSNVPRDRLITSGPFSLVKHPLYTAVALLVIPSAGVLSNSWLGVAVGIVMYVGSRIFARAEEADLSRRFGRRWIAYANGVKLRRA
jgi:protein-S-isoprenylcysteine O-methyltransferase Ste14